MWFPFTRSLIVIGRISGAPKMMAHEQNGSERASRGVAFPLLQTIIRTAPVGREGSRGEGEGRPVVPSLSPKAVMKRGGGGNGIRPESQRNDPLILKHFKKFFVLAHTSKVSNHKDSSQSKCFGTSTSSLQAETLIYVKLLLCASLPARLHF